MAKLSVGTKNFELVTLTLIFDILLKKNFTLVITFEPREIRLSYYTCVLLVARPFCWYQFTKNFELVTLTLIFDLLLKKHNLGHNFWTKRDMAFILHMCITCSKTFLLVPIYKKNELLTLILTYFWKNLTLAITFEPREIRLLYYTSILLVARPFCWYQKIWTHELDLDFRPTFEKT